MDIVIRRLKIDEVEKIRSIDRSEVIENIFVFSDHKLIEKDVHYDMKGFSISAINNIIERQKELIMAKGEVFGAFDGDLLVGVASVENKIRGSKNRYCKMDILHVSNKYRKKGIATRLIAECKNAAMNFGANRLYISATESKNTVEFYQKRGAILVEELDDELFKLEPEDIHLEIEI
jgi:N-acetylglutamate synthase-like GNAT family acetyltransferase